MVRSKSLDHAVVVTRNMPDAPDGYDYVLWFDHDGDMEVDSAMPDGPNNTILMDGDAAHGRRRRHHRRARGRAPQPSRATTRWRCSASSPHDASDPGGPTAGRRIAVVGSGVAGLTAAYVASRTAHVTLFEADDRLGGHADTHLRRRGRTATLAIDTGFIVHNPRTYPVLLRLFAELGVATQPSEMSMSIRDDDSGLEWAGALGRRGLFPTSANLRGRATSRCSPRSRGSTARRGDCSASTTDDRTLREFLADGRFSSYFTRHFMEPLVAAVWSCDPDVALDYPARYLFTFLDHHGMLGVFGSPQWRTVTGGSHEYVRRVGAVLPDVRLGTKVTSVLETADGVEVTDGNGEVETFDGVVMATHPGQALSMLAAPTALQRELLGAMPYSPNPALLHTDASVLPEADGACASWNFRRLLLDGG